MTLNMAAVDTNDFFPSIILLVFLNLIDICGRRHVFCKGIGSPDVHIVQDLLLPYKHFHGPKHRNRYVRECQPAHFGNVTYSVHPAHEDPDKNLPVVDSRVFVKNIAEYEWNTQYAYGHHFIVNNPHKTVSVLEPLEDDGCERKLVSTVAETAARKKCLVAINAGFFNTSSHACIGNVVSYGREAHNSGGIQNAHFGIMKNGSIYIGYIPEETVLEDTFSQLVGGVIWLVRNGVNYVDTSKEAECSDSQETGNLQTFIDVQSARTAVGHDKEGRVIILQVEGKSWQRGGSLYDMAKLLIELGAVNAINLDGGGSSSVVREGLTVNFPSDSCTIGNMTYGCARNVSTVLCVHDIECLPHSCNDHGDCHHGDCACHEHWIGEDCSRLQCGATNCSRHGACTPDGCDCHPGWSGKACTKICRPGTFGYKCKSKCGCVRGHRCHPVTGQCQCPSGFQGYHCEEGCPYGAYGENCRGVCNCPKGCSCDPITGSCSIFSTNTTLWRAGQCMSEYVVVYSEDIVLKRNEMQLWFTTVVVLCLLAISSMVLNITLICIKCQRKSQESPRLNHKSYKSIYEAPRVVRDSFSSSADDECSDDSFENIALRQMSPVKSAQVSRASPMESGGVTKSETEPNLTCMAEL